MSVPVLTFFNNKGGVGKTSLVYHLAWMLSRTGERVLTCDLDPQASLTAFFMSDDSLEGIWRDTKLTGAMSNRTIFQCVKPLMEAGGINEPCVHDVSESLGLIPGDLALSGFENSLSEEWPKAMDEDSPCRPFRILSAFWQILQAGAASMQATIVLVDAGPNLGALNRSALIATDCVIAPLGADLFSLQGLENLGPALSRWRKEWAKRRDNRAESDFPLPEGNMRPVGYIVQQPAVRMDRPVRALDKWVNKMPEAYHRHLLGSDGKPFPLSPHEDEHCLATVRHYRSLVPMAQEARKPMFDLTSADGAIGAHAKAVSNAYQDFRELAGLIMHRMKFHMTS